MILVIDDASDIPIYMQIRNQIVKGISDGTLEKGEQLPTVRALAQEIGINAMTVNKAYQTLKREGYIFTDRRNGAKVMQSFSQEKALDKSQEEALKQIIAEAKIQGMTREDFIKLCEKLY